MHTYSDIKSLKLDLLTSSEPDKRCRGLGSMPDSLNFRLWDTMGWAENAYVNGEIELIMQGHIPSGTDLSKRLSFATTPGFIAAPTLAHRVRSLLFSVFFFFQ